MHQLAAKSDLVPEAEARSSSDGFILVNSSFKPVFVNPLAAEILSFPQKLDGKYAESFLAHKIRSLFAIDESAVVPASITSFRSGRRLYEGRAYRVNSVGKVESQVSFAILLQRRAKPSLILYGISEKYNLTRREQQVVQYLTYGSTTKEIAAGLEISPNTVKNFVRMIMVKMGVSTRSGIVGRALGTGE